MTPLNSPQVRISERFLRPGEAETASPSERAVLDLLSRRGSLTQGQLTDKTDLSQQSVSRLVSGLMDRGLVRTGARIATGKRGTQSAAIEINPDFAVTIGISVMSDAISVALLNFGGQVLGEHQAPLPSMSRGDVLAELAAVVEQLTTEYVPDRNRLLGIGVAMSGYFVDSGPHFNTPPTLQDWALIDLEQVFADHFGLPVWVDNDGNAAAIGEAMVGVGQWADDFAYLYFSAGFGGGVIQNGKLRRGKHGNAGEFAAVVPAHTHARPNLEILRQCIAKHGVPLETVHDLVTQFDPTWPGIDEWITKVRDSLNLVISAVLGVLDNDAIVFGGRIPKGLAEQVIAELSFNADPRRDRPLPVPKLVPAEATGEATAIGAAALPLKHSYFG